MKGEVHMHRNGQPQSRVTILRGGVEITFRGYLNDKTCPICKQQWPAADFLKEIKIDDGRRYLVFGPTCQYCERPIKPFPADLHGARLKDSFVDDRGRRGWFQRTKAGTFGPELPLSRMTLRQTADGVWRPQPKLDRKRAHARSEDDRWLNS
jgi:hypothetical protein